MDGARRERLRTTSVVALAGAGLVQNLAAAALFDDAAPYVGFLALARLALPGIALAVAAVLVGLLAPRAGAGALLAVGSITASASGLAIGLEQWTPWWVAIGAAGRLAVPVLVAVALSFPTGRRTPAGWLVTRAGVGLGAVAGGFELLTYDPGGWGWCRCAANPIALVSLPEAYPRALAALDVVDAGVLAAGLAVLLAGVPRTRLDWALVATYAALTLADVAGSLVAVTSPDGPTAAAAILRDAALVLLPVVLVAGFLAHRPSRAHVADLLLAAREEEYDPFRLQTLVGRAIGDPAVVVAWWDVGTAAFRDPAGRSVAEPPSGVLRVEADGRPVTLVVGARLDDVPVEVREAVVEALLLAAENRRLTRELHASLEQVRDSRSRIVTAGDEARRRIERDLHDGAQQLLVATGIKLNLATQAVRSDAADPAIAGLLGEASAELGRALSELRGLAAGIAPTSLVHGTLRNALAELALRSPVPTVVQVTGGEDPEEPVAATVYFVVAECLTNAAKHARADAVVVDVALGDPVRVSVRDDGRGGATLVGTGTGLRGLVDRVEARGGRLELISGSAGTTITATVPR